MAIEVKHAFVSAKGDGSDATLVRPSNWNANHDIELASNRIIGRLTAGPGDAEELPVTPFMIGLLNTADIAALAIALGLPTTGDALLTFKTVATSGWVLMNDGSIGDATSGATTLAHASTQALFTLLYNNMNDTNAPIQTSAGAGTTRATQGTATTAFGAHCRLVLSKQLGRAIIIGGAGAGLTARALGGVGGEETHVLTQTELPAHTHTQQGSFAGSGSGSGSISGSGTGTGSGSCAASGTVSGNTAGHSVDHSHYTGNTNGSGGMIGGNPHAHGVSGGTKGGTSNVGLQGGGTYFGLAYAGDNNIAINNTDVNHTHNTAWGAQSGGVNTDHSHAVGIGVSVSGSCSVSSLSVSVTGSCSVTSVSVNTTISGQTGNIGSGTAHNVMQPFTTWNVMIKL